MLSKISIIFAVIGVMFFGFSYVYSNKFELLMVTGIGVLFIGLLLSFGAMFKREQGSTKFLAIAAFFLFSFLITAYDPFQIVRLLTWIKN